MLIYWAFTFFANFLTLIFYFVPSAKVVDVWFIGEFASNLLGQIGTTWNAFMVTFPYAEIAWNVFIFGILPFEFALAVLKFFIGHRIPSQPVVD